MKIIAVTLLMTFFSFTSFAQTQADKQSINLTSVNNARELGGYITNDGRKIKHGVLLRTAVLNKISSEDITRLTQDYNLSVIADFRMSFEAAAKPDPVIEGVKYVNLRVIDEELFMREIEKRLAGEKDPFELLKTTAESGVINENMYIDFLSGNFGKKRTVNFSKNF